MKYHAPQRLFRALLFEMTSGNYKAGERFLSHRRIMRHWQVSTPTANKTLQLLREAGLLQVVDSSGHYLKEDFRERALLLLAAEPAQPAKRTPVREPLFRARLISGRSRGDAEALRVGVVLFREGLKMRQRAEIAESSGRDAGASLTARSIFLQGEENRTLIDFIACSGTAGELEVILDRLSRTARDGVIFLCRTPGIAVAPLAEALLQRFIPVVSLFNDCEGTDMVSVNFNNIGMGAHAAEVLMEKGYERVGVLVPHIADRNYMDRALGFERRLAQTGVQVWRFPMDAEDEPSSLKRLAAAIECSKCTALYSTGHQFFEALLPVMNTETSFWARKLALLSSSSTPDVPCAPGEVDILHMDFEGLGHLAYRALRDYRGGEVAQKCYFLNPPYQSFGTVQAAG